jgi:hypothetical protein
VPVPLPGFFPLSLWMRSDFGSWQPVFSMIRDLPAPHELALPSFSAGRSRFAGIKNQEVLSLFSRNPEVVRVGFTNVCRCGFSSMREPK